LEVTAPPAVTKPEATTNVTPAIATASPFICGHPSCRWCAAACPLETSAPSGISRTDRQGVADRRSRRATPGIVPYPVSGRSSAARPCCQRQWRRRESNPRDIAAGVKLEGDSKLRVERRRST